MREAIHNLEASKIREVANAGLGRSDVLAFWFGESDEVTPAVDPRGRDRVAAARRDLLRAQPRACPSCARRVARYMSGAASGDRGRAHRRHLVAASTR